LGIHPLITIIIIAPFLWALALRRVAVKRRYYLRNESIVNNNDDDFFRMGLALFYIDFIEYLLLHQ
jgi:CPA2 family monovalent cation:H+ antiporter-2